ncbi:uncharacterized protein LOC133881112 [Alnus glutinosa]|uniref:uncharacterized protein LOC133881112 n=2 Tax=Alnus glutinosa TaxID=3517 RepID=UPI002D78693C|nr:uncharacterized protein LOC133881112 [Alnus glutinosa]
MASSSPRNKYDGQDSHKFHKLPPLASSSPSNKYDGQDSHECYKLPPSGNSTSPGSNNKKACSCSPTTHQGSFRCSLHKAPPLASHGGDHGHQQKTASYHLRLRRLALRNSLLRIGGMEGGDLVKRLSALIRLSSHQKPRRTAFQPRPSRLSLMSKAEPPFRKNVYFDTG